MGAGRVILFIAGVVEFLLSGMMFLMANFGLAGYLILAYMPTEQGATYAIQLYMGILAVVAFIFGLAGAASAIERWSLLLSVFGGSLIALWGLLQTWYTLTWLTDRGEIQIGVTEGTIAVFFSLLVITLLVASKEQFRIPLFRTGRTWFSDENSSQHAP
jgi:hypothetical protein